MLYMLFIHSTISIILSNNDSVGLPDSNIDLIDYDNETDKESHPYSRSCYIPKKSDNVHYISWFKRIKIILKFTLGYLRRFIPRLNIRPIPVKARVVKNKLFVKEKILNGMLESINQEINELSKYLCNRYPSECSDNRITNLNLDIDDSKYGKLKKLILEKESIEREFPLISYLKLVLSVSEEEDDIETRCIGQNKHILEKNGRKIEIEKKFDKIEIYYNNKGDSELYHVHSWDEEKNNYFFIKRNYQHCYDHVVRLKKYCGPRLRIRDFQEISDYEYRVSFESYLTCTKEKVKEAMRVRTEEKLEIHDIIAPDNLSKMNWVIIGGWTEEKFETDNLYCPPLDTGEYYDL